MDEVVEKTRAPEVAHRPRQVAPPLPSTARLVTRYGPRPQIRRSPQSFHTGLDFTAYRGTPVFAARPGTVTCLAHDGRQEKTFIGYGNAVVIHHEDEDLWSFYAHLDEHLVTPDMRVVAGQAIGRVGNTTNGRSPLMLPRLHLEIRVRGRDGEPPYPGPYRINNRDPELWLRSRGVVFDRMGRFVNRNGAASKAVDSEDPALAETLADYGTPTPVPYIPDEE
jgi:murein DD-endopeptidase MepM/ murein hydrolase activator NlpD